MGGTGTQNSKVQGERRSRRVATSQSTTARMGSQRPRWHRGHAAAAAGPAALRQFDLGRPAETSIGRGRGRRGRPASGGVHMHAQLRTPNEPQMRTAQEQWWATAWQRTCRCWCRSAARAATTTKGAAMSREIRMSLYFFVDEFQRGHWCPVSSFFFFPSGFVLKGRLRCYSYCKKKSRGWESGPAAEKTDTQNPSSRCSTHPAFVPR